MLWHLCGLELDVMDQYSMHISHGADLNIPAMGQPLLIVTMNIKPVV